AHGRRWLSSGTTALPLALPAAQRTGQRRRDHVSAVWRVFTGEGRAHHLYPSRRRSPAAVRAAPWDRGLDHGLQPSHPVAADVSPGVVALGAGTNADAGPEPLVLQLSADRDRPFPHPPAPTPRCHLTARPFRKTY